MKRNRYFIILLVHYNNNVMGYGVANHEVILGMLVCAKEEVLITLGICNTSYALVYVSVLNNYHLLSVTTS